MFHTTASAASPNKWLKSNFLESTISERFSRAAIYQKSCNITDETGTPKYQHQNINYIKFSIKEKILNGKLHFLCSDDQGIGWTFNKNQNKNFLQEAPSAQEYLEPTRTSTIELFLRKQ